MIEQFRAKAATKDVSLSGVFSLQQCDLKALPLELENESFDVVTITQVLHHLLNGLDEHRPVYKRMRLTQIAARMIYYTLIRILYRAKLEPRKHTRGARHTSLERLAARTGLLRTAEHGSSPPCRTRD